MTNTQEKEIGSKVRNLFPILKWLPDFNWKDIRFDEDAGRGLATGYPGIITTKHRHSHLAVLELLLTRD